MDTRLLETKDDSEILTPNPRYDLECPTEMLMRIGLTSWSLDV